MPADVYYSFPAARRVVRDNPYVLPQEDSLRVFDNIEDAKMEASRLIYKGDLGEAIIYKLVPAVTMQSPVMSNIKTTDHLAPEQVALPPKSDDDASHIA